MSPIPGPPLKPRYQTVSIPASYGRLDSSPAPGAVAGIILGSVAGFIFLLYLAYLGLGLNNKPSDVTSTTTGTMPRRVRRQQQQQRRSEPMEERPRPRDHISVEQSVSASRTDDGDVVEVIEEHSSVDAPPRSRGGRSRSRAMSGSYRTVDPYDYGEDSYVGR